MRKLVKMAWDKSGEIKNILTMIIYIMLTIALISMITYILAYKLIPSLTGGG